MKKKIGLGIVAITVVAASAFFGAACSSDTDSKDDKNTYTVTFDANGGAFSNGNLTTAKSVKSGGYASYDGEPQRDDYFFYGWVIAADDTEVVDLSKTAIVKNTTFYAGWLTAANITYYYNYVGAPNSGVYKTDKVAHGSLVAEPAKPAREDYTFDCWTIDTDGYNEWAFSTDKAMKDVSLYAQWTNEVEEQTLRTVTLHIGNETETRRVVDNKAFAEPESPEKAGYDFIEWRVGSLSGDKYNFGSVVTSDLHLYAYFEQALPANKHRINYILDDGTSTAAKNSSYNPTVFTEGGAVALADPSRACYTFEGWYKDSGFNTKVASIGGSEKGDVTLYAKWKYSYPYFVTGDHVGWNKYPDFSTIQGINAVKEECAMYPLVTGVGANRTWDGNTYVAERIYLLKSGDPTTTGFKIIAYGATATNNTVWFGAQGKNTGDTNIAVPEDGYYTVTIKVINSSSIDPPAISLRKFTASFVLDNDEITVDDQTVKDGDLITKPVIQGGSVVWYTDPQKTKTWNFASTQVTGDITLYGKYSVKSYMVVYANLDHLTWDSAVNTVEYGETLDLGYTLDKGYTQSEIKVTVNNEIVEGTTFVVTGLDDIDVIVVNISGNLFIKTYTVTFMERDATEIGEVLRVKSGESVTAPSPEDLTHCGERFIGWRDENDNNKMYPTDDPNITFENIESDMVLFAEYDYIYYSVTFDSNGGSHVASQTGLVFASSINKPADPSKDNYEFKGWFTEDGVEWNFATGHMPAENITLYAKWELVAGVEKYTVSFLYQKDGEQYDHDDVSASSGIVSKPSAPTRNGYTFDKWYDADTNSAFDFDSAIAGDKILYAVWTLDAPSVTLEGFSGEYKAGGHTLTAEASHLLNGVTYGYKWYKGGDLISGAISSTYTVADVADSGSYSVEVTASDGSLVSQPATANATVSIEKAVLPTIETVAFKNDNAYTNTIVFEAESTSLATGYSVTVLDYYDNLVETIDVDINDREFSVTAGLYSYCTIKITHKGLVSDNSENIENTTGIVLLWFKGNGTAATPYSVETADDLMRVSDHPTAHFEQGLPINATGISALFTSSTPFTGVYDGKEKTISNITDRNGLFGYIGEGAVVKNIKLTAVAISSGSVDFVGAVASENSGTIDNVTVGVKGDNSVSNNIDSNISSSVGEVAGDNDVGDYAVGGIVGKNSGTVINCINNARLWGNKCVGGIVGYNVEGAIINNCTNNGLIGTNTTTANPNSFMSYAGGLVGKNAGTLLQSINNGNVTAYKATNSSGNSNSYYGGFAARNEASGTIGECINNGVVRTDFAAAGLVSRNYGTVEYCINTASVNARNTASSGMATGNGQILYCVMTGTANLTNSASSSSVGGSLNCSGSGASTVKYSYYNSSSDAPSTKATVSNNAVYDVSSQTKIDATLAVLGEKFVWDGTKITLKFTVS